MGSERLSNPSTWGSVPNLPRSAGNLASLVAPDFSGAGAYGQGGNGPLGPTAAQLAADPIANPANWTQWHQPEVAAGIRAKPTRGGLQYSGPPIQLPQEISPEAARALAAQQQMNLAAGIPTAPNAPQNAFEAAGRGIQSYLGGGGAGGGLSAYNPPANYMPPPSSGFPAGADPFGYNPAGADLLGMNVGNPNDWQREARGIMGRFDPSEFSGRYRAPSETNYNPMPGRPGVVGLAEPSRGPLPSPLVSAFQRARRRQPLRIPGVPSPF